MPTTPYKTSTLCKSQNAFNIKSFSRISVPLENTFQNWSRVYYYYYVGGRHVRSGVDVLAYFK